MSDIDKIRKELKEIREQLREILRQLHHHPREQQKVKMVLLSFINNQKYIIMDPLSLPSNQQAPIVVGLIDADTLAPITDAVKANETETSDNTAAATVDANNNLVGVAPGTGNLTSKADWTYTDKNTNQLKTVTETVVTPFTVTAVVTAENVAMVVSLGTPVLQTPPPPPAAPAS